MVDIYLAKPRGFCAGVTRAIDTVKRAIEKFGVPIYVRHEIVHNKYVVNSLKEMGAIFVDEIEEIPSGSIVIFSAHGVSTKVEEDAKYRDLNIIDATCPLVSKVHRKAKKLEEEDYEIILIGHKNHPEVEGTKGRVKKEIILVTNEEDANKLELDHSKKATYVTQTTLSVNDTKKIVGILENRLPNLEKGLSKNDICYATQNRQDAVNKLSEKVEILLVIGAENSSNSNRLRDLGEEYGLKSYLINDSSDINEEWFNNINKIGITAGASAPEVLVQEVIEKIKTLFYNQTINLYEIEGENENTYFVLPKEVR